MARPWFVVLLVALGLGAGACKFEPRLVGDDGSDDAGPRDGRTDDMMKNTICFGTGFVKPCFAVMPTGTIAVDTDRTLDTSNPANCTSNVDGTNVDGVCVIAAASINITRKFDVIGTKPLVLVATDTISLSTGNARLDGSSYRSNNRVGPGAGATVLGQQSCDTGTLPATGRGGGAGGSFGGKGGDAGGGGIAGGAQRVMTLRAGCPGQAGGAGAMGGSSGGAVYLIAGNAITLASSTVIDVSGAGGAGGGAVNGGAAGGGSGGMIGFDAPTFTNNGQIWANGGGGGEGADLGSGGSGSESPDPTTRADPGAGDTLDGGNGGFGSADTTLTGQNGGSSVTGVAGHGGGGGGAGIIKVFATTVKLGSISPAPI